MPKSLGTPQESSHRSDRSERKDSLLKNLCSALMRVVHYDIGVKFIGPIGQRYLFISRCQVPALGN